MCDVNEEEIDFNDEDRKVEEEMAEIFFDLPQEKR